MKLKKILGLLVAGIMLIGSINVSAITTEDLAITNSAEYEQTKEMFSSLGLLSGQVDYSNEKANVKREDFVMALLRIADADKVNPVTEAVFTDVDVDYPVAAYIKKGVDLGFLAGYENGSFGPKNDLLLEQAVKVVVKVLGYSKEAELQGGYPNGYLTVADNLKLLDGIDASTKTALTYGELLTMFENAFDVEVPKFVLSGGSVSIENESGRTFLDIYHDIYIEDGIVNANEITALLKHSATRTGWVKIGDTSYYVGETSIAASLGYDVEYFYKQTEDDDVGTILYFELTEKNFTYEIDDEDLYKDNKSTSSYKYYDERDREKDITITANTNVIVNGKQKAGFSVADLNPAYGSVKLIDNNEDEIFDIIEITSIDQTIFVNTVSVADESYTIVDKDDPTNSVELKVTEPASYVVLKDGQEIKPTEIVATNVVSICKNGDYIKVLVSDKAIEEAKIESKVAENEVIIDDEEVMVGAAYIDKASKNIKLPQIKIGTQGTFYLDVFGRIAGIAAESSLVTSYGVTLKLYKSVNDENKATLKILDESGAIERLDLAEEVRYNGKKMEVPDVCAALEYKSENASKYDDARKSADNVDKFRQLIMYSLNDEGKISKIYTSESDELEYEGSFEVHVNTSESTYEYWTYNWARRYYQGTQTKVFQVAEDEEICRVISGATNLKTDANEKNHIGTYYFFNQDDALTVDVAIKYIKESSEVKNSVSASGGFYVVVAKYEGLDASDEPVSIVKVLNDSGTAIELYPGETTDQTCKDALAGLNVGDIIKYKTASNGDLSGVKKVLDIKTSLDYYAAGMSGEAGTPLNQSGSYVLSSNGTFLSFNTSSEYSMGYVKALYVNGTSLVANVPNINPDAIASANPSSAQMAKVGVSTVAEFKELVVEEGLNPRMTPMTSTVTRVDLTNLKNITVESGLSPSVIMPGDSILYQMNYNNAKIFWIIKH